MKKKIIKNYFQQKANKKILTILLALMLALSLVACGNKDNKYSSSLLKTGYKNLYYDTRTNIVYYVLGNRMTTYYCEHGIPYSFNPTTGELICISN